MPANLPPDARKKWAEVEETHNPRERLQKMEEFLSLVPKHKGTAKTCAQVKKQMSSLRKEIEEKKKKKKASKGGPKTFIEKEGAAQVALISMTKAGKSSLLSSLTRAKVEISNNLYTTRNPVPGIMTYQDLQIQMIEAPALMEGAADGRAWGLQTLGIARNADGLIIVVDLAQDPVKQLSIILDELSRARISTIKPTSKVEIERKYMGIGLRIIVFGRLVNCTFKEVEELLKGYNVTDAVVKISGDATLSDVEEAIFETMVYRPTVVIANKIDVPGAEGNLRRLQAYLGDRLPVVAVSALTGIGLDKIGENLFNALEIIRIYTKEPNEREYSKKPFILRKGSTIYNLAKSIHSDFKDDFYFARVWSERLVFSPQKVGSTFKLQDGDVVEIHLK
jgi:ribosome-interacting GTPase 1